MECCVTVHYVRKLTENAMVKHIGIGYTSLTILIYARFMGAIYTTAQ